MNKVTERLSQSSISPASLSDSPLNLPLINKALRGALR